MTLAAAEKTHLEYITKFVAAREKSPKWALFALKSEVERLLPDNRVKVCYHHRLPTREDVEIWYNAEQAKAHYRGLMKCGQGWVCPVCAQRLAVIRKGQLKMAIENARVIYLPILVTYTAQHYQGQPLAKLLEGMTAAYRRMRQQRLWRVYKEEYLIRGEVRAMEVTYGDNGWHPHFHVISFLDKAILQTVGVNADNQFDIFALTAALETHLTPLWLESLAAFSLTAQAGPALNARAGFDTLDSYLSKQGDVLPSTMEKWGLAEEATMGQLKKSHRDGKTIWDILIESFCGNALAGDLFKEYASATKGRSGLQWTPGLKNALGVVADETAILSDDETELADILLMRLSVDVWRAVVATQAVGKLLDVASTGDPAKLRAMLQKVNKRYTEQK